MDWQNHTQMNSSGFSRVPNRKPSRSCAHGWKDLRPPEGVVGSVKSNIERC